MAPENAHYFVVTLRLFAMRGCVGRNSALLHPAVAGYPPASFFLLSQPDPLRWAPVGFQLTRDTNRIPLRFLQCYCFVTLSARVLTFKNRFATMPPEVWESFARPRLCTAPDTFDRMQGGGNTGAGRLRVPGSRKIWVKRRASRPKGWIYGVRRRPGDEAVKPKTAPLRPKNLKGGTSE